MEEAGHSHYVAQLKAEFDGCDTTATGFLDRDELTELCRRLQLDAQLPLLLHTLLGERTHGRVNFEEFKEAFVEVLSRSLDLNTSEDDSSYLDSAVFEEMKPKFVKGAKRYGRRSRPDSEALTCDSEDSPPSKNEATDSSASGVRRAKQRRSTSLESVESLKSDEDTGSQRNIQPPFQSKGEEEQLEAGGGEGLLTDHLSLQHLHSEDMNGRFCRTEAQLDGGVSITEFRRFLSSSSPASRSTPKRGADLQRAPHWSQAPLEERPARSAAPSLLTATVGQRVLSRLDDGSGCTSPERVAALWTEEGIQNSRDILQTLDFSLEERLSLADLTLALDNELLVSGNGIHQAALISYKNEIQLLQEAAEQACRERDKLRADLEEADHRNLQLVREVDDRHASMETLNQSKIRDLEQDFRDRLTTLRCEAELESEAQLQLGEQERRALQEELQLLRAQEAELQEELRHAAQENRRLEEELRTLKEKLTEAETSTNRLQADLSQLLLHKFGGLDPAGSALSHEERVSELIKEYELQCRVLQDKNDELSLELEILKNRRRRREAGDASAPSWKQQHEESDDLDMNRSSSPPVTQPDQKPAPDGAAGPTVSIQTELAVEQLQQKHRQELQQLSIQLETQMNFYERSLEKMRESMEVERKDISQAFKLEISELEEQKTQLEQEVKQLKAALDRLQKQTLHGGGGGWSSEQERRMQRERAELEQNFAREIGNLVQRLSSEKEQLEAELKLKMDQEVMAVKTQLEEVRFDNQALQERLSVLQHQVQNLEEEVSKKRRRLEELEQEHQRSREEEERLHKENSRCREEVLDLSSRNLKLSSDNGELSARLRQEQESLQKLQEAMTRTSKQEEEEVRRLQEEVKRKEQEELHQQEAWREERRRLEEQLSSSREKLKLHQHLEAELSSLTMKVQLLQEDKEQLQKAAVGRQEQLLAVKQEAELLRSQLHTVTQEKIGHAQEVVELRRKLLEVQSQVEEQHGQTRRLQEQEEELHRLMVQNQQLQEQVSELQVQELQVHKLSQDQQNLRTRLSQAEAARTQALDQAAQADAALALLQGQLQRQKHQEGGGLRERAELLQVQLDAEEKRSRQLEENLKLQVQQSRSQFSMKQEQYEKAMSALQQRVDDLEVKLKGVRLVLQEKVQELREQLVKSSKASALLKDAHAENAQLMMALQVTERRQKLAERRSVLLEEKVGALHQLLRDIVPAALAT
ncbi:ninein-like protein isoform X1 [Oryzias melastigma]|uniref:ninein-like protein isoform X1 n=1 Tax=Oryzias melastigma TaxID=30732 RepID=UPI000CF8027F|nr:ninein-like protein isoform X1 [Oryzias melastigma]